MVEVYSLPKVGAIVKEFFRSGYVGLRTVLRSPRLDCGAQQLIYWIGLFLRFMLNDTIF